MAQDRETATPVRRYNPGERVEATYDHDLIPPDFRGNPHIEALSPDGAEGHVLRALVERPPYDPAHRAIEDPMTRFHLIDSVTRFFVPLPKTWELTTMLSRTIRQGYVGRNPLFRLPAGQVRAMLAEADPPVVIRRIYDENVRAFAAIGSSGIGKSTNVAIILRLQPQVIVHAAYRGARLDQMQVVYLILVCPKDRSLRSLCLAFFEAVDELLGTDYYREWGKNGRGQESNMLLGMKVVARQINLGVLVLDEIQFLAEAARGCVEEVMNFLTYLINKAKIPVVFVGTRKAHKVLGARMHIARRSGGFGDFEWDQIARGADWDMFVRALWRYNYLKEEWPATPPTEIVDVLWRETQGVTDFAVKVFLQAQVHAIRAHQETMTPHLLEAVAVDRLRIARPLLLALRAGDVVALQDVDDIEPIHLEPYREIAAAEIRRMEGRPPADGAPGFAQLGLPGFVGTPAPVVAGAASVAAGSAPDTGPRPRDRRPGRPRGTGAAAPGMREGFPKAVADGHKARLTAYEGLVEAGHTAHVEEFVPRAVAS